jgi:hypothetical protein
MKVPYYKGKKLTRRFVRKKSGSSIKYENVVKIRVFRLFLKNGSNDFSQNAPECRTNQYWTARENRMSKFCSVLELFIHKVVIFGQNGQKEVQNEVQRSSNNSRTVNARKNLIQYSESAENSLSPMFHQILPSCSSLGSKNNFSKNRRSAIVITCFQ